MKMMNKFSKVFAVAAILFGISFSEIQAQNDGQKQMIKKEFKSITPEDRAQKFTDRLDKQVSLNEAQKKQIYEIKLKAIQENKDLAQKKKNLQTESREHIKNVLTAEQTKNLEEAKAQKRGKGQWEKGNFKKGNWNKTQMKGHECQNMKMSKGCCMQKGSGHPGMNKFKHGQNKETPSGEEK